MNRRVLRMLGLLLWALAALACAGASPGDMGNGQPQGDGASAGPATACQSDADCVVVETACCDHCNGGKAEAFNKAHANEHRPQGCGGGCTRLGCGDAIAVCENNTCQVEILPLGS
ncbi:hypothetical protein [Polyangium jinanense]|uniref:Secreted protein n=1 Tax=Polyangium jinanense TaxID=2829994 RepID=A0A9X4AZ83_9BACT|nr:hypothetical protein [Polyangium jinanense]MDC3959800.1 hypothetical protein [Polyangium jinanense]MDC3988055.1 hypothetical protein [Polyangium jinanense]